jgi:hypothetical protein
VFVHDEFICLRPQKCASVRIGEILCEHVGGELRGHHQRIDIPLGERKVITSIRNPWSWYVSLWAFGCKGGGNARYRLTSPPPRLRSFPRFMLRSRRAAVPRAIALQDFKARRNRDPESWKPLYADADDPELFRQWLRRVHDPSTAAMLDPYYAACGVANIAGLLTWRYLRLVVRDIALLHERRDWTNDDLLDLDRQQNLCTYVMRIEDLPTELPAALKSVGYKMSDERRASIIAAASSRSNVSNHRPSADYYDDASIALVAAREHLVIEKHGYEPPVASLTPRE